MLRELRYAIRSLTHSKAFAAVAILCLGLGIGINTTIFSIIDGVLLTPFPYDDPDRVVVLETWRARDEARDRVSIPIFAIGERHRSRLRRSPVSSRDP